MEYQSKYIKYKSKFIKLKFKLDNKIMELKQNLPVLLPYTKPTLSIQPIQSIQQLNISEQEEKQEEKQEVNQEVNQEQTDPEIQWIKEKLNHKTNTNTIDKPVLLFVTGKYASGKTSTTKKIKQEFGENQVAIIELDQIVREYIQQGMDPDAISKGAGFEVYKGEGSEELINRFINGTRENIIKNLQSKIIILEGALSSSDVLNKIINPDPDFESESILVLYFQPVNKSLHKKRIISRMIVDIENNTCTLPGYWGSTGKFDREYLYEQISGLEPNDKVNKLNELCETVLSDIIDKYLEDAEQRALKTMANFSKDNWVVMVKQT